jgi:hypothetical protein
MHFVPVLTCLHGQNDGCVSIGQYGLDGLDGSLGLEHEKAAQQWPPHPLNLAQSTPSAFGFLAGLLGKLFNRFEFSIIS